MAGNKQYGLTLPKKQQQKMIPMVSNVFADDVSDEDDGTDWVRKALKAEGEKNRVKKQTKLDMHRALDQDPTIYQYDELYDDMERSKKQSNVSRCNEKKPKYIETLLRTAERRKKEQEHRIERMVQKEREAEGEMYADKESFVTSAYRAKLEEFKKMEEEEARMNKLEAIADVTKQRDMSGFYRHLYKQTVDHKDENGSDKSIGSDERTTKEKMVSDTKKMEQSTVMNKAMNATMNEKLKATKLKKSRQYRQRVTETCVSDSEIETSKIELKKGRVAASSIDKAADEPKRKKCKQSTIEEETNECNIDHNMESKDSSVKDAEISRGDEPIDCKNEKAVSNKRSVEEKKDRSSIWEKRTVGLVFEAALQRYYARKAVRLAMV